MEVSTINTVLGQRAGVLELVFRLLPLRDLKNVVLVCHLWREVGEAPGFWAWGVIRMKRSGCRPNIEERLNCRRLRAVREIRVIGGVKVTDEAIQAMASHSGLKVVGMGNVNLSLVDPSLLARAVVRLEQVNMYGAKLTEQQVEEIFTAISEKNGGMKKLVLGSNNLSAVGPGLVVSAVKQVEELNVEKTQLTRKQAEAILIAISEGICELKKLDISNNDFSTVSPWLLASALNRLEEVVISDDTQLTKEQVEAILTKSCLKTSLKKLQIAKVWADILDGELVARAGFVIRELVLGELWADHIFVSGACASTEVGCDGCESFNSAWKKRSVIWINKK